MENEKSEQKTYTQEEVDKLLEGYVSKEEFTKLANEHSELIAGFNALLEEYNALHIAKLVPNLVAPRK